MALRQVLLTIHIFIICGQDACETATADLAEPVHSPTVDAEHLLLQAKIKSTKVAVENADTISTLRNPVNENGNDQPDPPQEDPDYPNELSEDEEGSISFATGSSESHSSQPQEDPDYPNGPVSLATDSSKSRSSPLRSCGWEAKRFCLLHDPSHRTSHDGAFGVMRAQHEVADEEWIYLCMPVQRVCPKYRFGTKGSSLCPEDYRNIVNKDECVQALAALGGYNCLDFMGGRHGANGMIGCTRNTNNNCWHFNVDNTNADATHAGYYHMHHQSNYVCIDENWELAAWPQSGADNRKCAVEQIRVASQEQCQTRAKNQGYPYYSYTTQAGSSNNCGTFATCDSPITGTTWDWKIFHEEGSSFLNIRHQVQNRVAGICEDMCKEVGAYPQCAQCPGFVAPDSTPGVMTWDELLEHMDNLVEWGQGEIKGWRSHAGLIKLAAALKAKKPL